jgi:hypothetical protein
MAASAKVIPAPTPPEMSPSESAPPTDISEQKSFQDIAALAYRYWQARGAQTDHRKKIGSRPSKNYKAGASER